VSFSKTSASSLSSSSFLFLSLTRDATRLISATILETRTDDVCGFGVISIAISFAGSGIVERVSLSWIKVLKKTVNCQHSQLFEKMCSGTLVKKKSTVNTLNTCKSTFMYSYFVLKFC